MLTLFYSHNYWKTAQVLGIQVHSKRPYAVGDFWSAIAYAHQGCAMEEPDGCLVIPFSLLIPLFIADYQNLFLLCLVNYSFSRIFYYSELSLWNSSSFNISEPSSDPQKSQVPISKHKNAGASEEQDSDGDWRATPNHWRLEHSLPGRVVEAQAYDRKIIYRREYDVPCCR